MMMMMMMMMIIIVLRFFKSPPLLLLLFTAIKLSLDASSPYTNKDKTNKNKYT